MPGYPHRMFANIGTLVARPGKRDDVVAVLTRPNPDLAAAGCRFYEVGVSDDEPDTIHVVELWDSREAHRASLTLDSVRAAITEAMPMLTGRMGGHHFTVTGSPLR